MITQGWQEKCLEEICSVKGGKRLPAGHSLKDEPTDHPYIKSRDIREGKISAAELQFLCDNTFDKIKRYIVNTGDVCITIVANIGDVGVVPRELDGANLTENAVKLTNLDKEVAPGFLGTLLSNPQYKAYMEQLSAGAAQAKLGIYKIRRIKILLPPFPTQRKIAAILTAYDNLIEVNKRRIALLEKMAEELYREWFVRMRFPGHQNTRFVKGVPEGWEVKRLDQIAEFENGDRGKNYPRSTDFVDTGIPFINAGHLVDGSIDIKHVNRITETSFNRITSGKIRPDDLLFCVRGSLGRLARVGTLNKGAIASSLVIVRASDCCNNSYLFYLLSGERGRQLVAELDNGVAQPNMSVHSLMRSLVLLPPMNLSKQFATHIQPIWHLMSVLRSQSGALKGGRDLLLPRLISGKLSVEDLDIQFPPSMQDDASH